MPGMIWSAITTAICSPSCCRSSIRSSASRAFLATAMSHSLPKRAESCWRSAARIPSSSSTQTMCSRSAVPGGFTRRSFAPGIAARGHRPGTRPTASFTGSGAGGGPSIGRRTSNRVRPGLAVDADRPAVLLHDARADAETETGPLALRLGGEERLEDARRDVGRDARTRILDRHDHVPVLRPWSRSESRPARPWPVSRCGSGSSTPDSAHLHTPLSLVTIQMISSH